MIPYGHQNISEDDIDEVTKVLKSDWLTQGPKVLEFERALADYCGAKYAVVCSNGTSALHLAYLAAGFKPGDEIITTPNTFVATTNMMLTVKTKPIFADIRLDTYNLDENQIERLITTKTKAIVPVHFAGQPCEMEKIRKIAKRNKLIVIEDACHALSAEYNGRRVGGLKSDMAVFSFHPVKPITTAEGGAILTDNKKYYEELLKYRSHGIHKNEKGVNVMTDLGFNYRLSDIQCALGISQLSRLDEMRKKRQAVADQYFQLLKNEKNIILPVEMENIKSAWHLFVVRTKKEADRDKLAKYLKENGIGVNFHYPAVYSQPYYQKNGYKIKLANMEIYKKTAITLPCYADLAKKDIEYIVLKIKQFFKQ